LGRNWHAFVSHHLGDLDHLEAYRAFERDLALYEELFSVEPALIAHDLHPDYASTRFAASRRLLLVPVQHHHAHMASCMAEHSLDEPVIGVTFDGAGLGTDGSVWGGEFLVGDYAQFHRAAHLRYVAMPGGEQAAREPWRMAASHLLDAGFDLRLLHKMVSWAALRTVETMLRRRVNAPLTSSMGRLFDAVAALAGVRTHVAYEGQAAMKLEWLATDAPTGGVYPWSIVENSKEMNGRGDDNPAPTWEIDTRPLIREVAADAERGSPAHVIARRFHSTMVEIVAEICGRIRKQTSLSTIVLSGGVFMNALLTREAESRLTEEGFAVYRHSRVPANDGGLSLGQLAVAAARTFQPNP
jgi:hydrogenase maturation protein HypF